MAPKLKHTHKLVANYYLTHPDMLVPDDPTDEYGPHHWVKGGYVKATKGNVSVVTLV